MKKTIFALPCMAAIALAAFVGMRTLERNKNINETLLMANVEALTEEEGTPVGNCYTEKEGIIGFPEMVDVCNSETSDEMIYPCPKDQKMVLKGVRGVCTK